MTFAFKVDRLKPAFAPEAYTLLSQCFRNAAATYSVNKLMTYAGFPERAHSFTPFVATVGEDPTPIGFVACAEDFKQSSEDNRVYMINSLAVRPDWRGLGVARLLMDFVQRRLADDWAGKQPAVITLGDETKLANPLSRFYEKMGFRRDPHGAIEFNGAPVMYKVVNFPLNGLK